MRILSITLEDESVLWASYLPFVQHGGLFIVSDCTVALHEKVEILLSLCTAKDVLWIPGTVIWISPPGEEPDQLAGFGVQLDDQQAPGIHQKIQRFFHGKEAYFIGLPTHIADGPIDVPRTR